MVRFLLLAMKCHLRETVFYTECTAIECPQLKNMFLSSVYVKKAQYIYIQMTIVMKIWTF
jgi:hypothetical protein